MVPTHWRTLYAVPVRKRVKCLDKSVSGQTINQKLVKTERDSSVYVDILTKEYETTNGL
ncbi:hypothetical protein AVEN_155922-1, partial [Araneus ventricosus]